MPTTREQLLEAEQALELIDELLGKTSKKHKRVCKVCDRILTKGYKKIKDNYYCQEHSPEQFKCKICGKPLVLHNLISHNEKKFCVECFHKIYRKCKRA